MTVQDSAQAPTVPVAVPARGRWRGTTLALAFDPRRNSVNALRLGLAGIVLLSHTLKLHGGSDPVELVTGSSVDAGTMAVDGFFALSGFLIVGSFLGSPSTGRFLWRRCLRILPGFWVCLLVTAFVLLPVAQLMERGTLAGFPLTGEESALSYVTSNAALFVRQYEVTGLLDGGSVNGSLYTLFYEFACYLGVAVLGAVGLLRRRTWPLLVTAALVWAFALEQLLTGADAVAGSETLSTALRFGAMFLAGALAHRLSARLPLSRAGGAVAALVLAQAVVLSSFAGGDPDGTLVYLLVAPPAVAYLVLLAGSSPRLRTVGADRDLSYGLYVYAWPAQKLVLLAGAAMWPVGTFGLVSLALALLLAWASWTWVESPALRLKAWTPAFLQREGVAGR
jgi:peptidoglycan/LPS O-acetylase OafA/YrhL